MTVDPQSQAAFIAALRKKADDAAAANPVLSDIRLLAKTLVDEARKRQSDGRGHTSIGAYLAGGVVSMIEAESADGARLGDDILLKLRALAQEGEIQAAAMCRIIDKQIPGGSIEKFIEVRAEHSTGKAIISAVPADQSALMKGAPGAKGPAIGLFGGPTTPKIFIAKG
jgi:hypothetical protein